MASNNSAGGGGVGFLGLLTIVFIVLKLVGKITWSWWWVLSPAIFSASALICIVLVLIGAAMFFGRGPVARKGVRR